MMAELLLPWRENLGARWTATFQDSDDDAPLLLLTAFMDPDGLWRGLVELKYQFGPEWKSPAPSPFATAELAKQWAEAQAEKLRDYR